MGLFDGTVGFYLSIILKANTGFDNEKSMQRLNSKTAVVMMVLACIQSLVGTGLSKI